MFSKKKREKAAIAILMVVFLGAIIAICALVLGFGMASSEKLRLKNIANIAALAAMEEYGSKIGQPAATQASAKDDAIIRANQLLSLNRLATTGSNWAQMEPSDNDGLKFGTWFSDNSDRQTPPPCANYPCFVEATSAASVVNAAKITIRNKDSNPIIAPFLRALGLENLYYTESATAAMVPRCVYFLVDASTSSVINTHGSLIPRPNPPTDCTTQNCSWFAYSVTGMTQAQINALKDFSLCPVVDSLIDGSQASYLIWGNARLFCNTVKGTNRGGDNSTINHYKNDYEDIITPFGHYLVDTYSDPMPLSAFLRGFNAGITQIKERLVGGDKVGIIGFSDGIITDTGLLGAQSTGAQMQMDLLLQLSNVRNRNTVPVISPNFLDWGWFPYRTISNSNMTSAILQAASTLADPAFGCPKSARKMIIMATDGMANCVSDITAPVTWDPAIPLAARYRCNNSYLGYSYASMEISGGTTFTSAFAPGFDGITLPDLLRTAKISLSVMLAGNHVQPNFLNVERPSSETSALSRYLFPLEAATRHYCGISSGGCNLFFDAGNAATISADYNAAINGTGVFRAPNSLWGDLVLKTGGVWCPLMPPYPGNMLNGELVPDSQRSSTVQINSIYNEDLPSQAMRCVREALGVNPYTLVTEVN